MTLPNAIQRYPELDDWIQIDAAGTITIRTGKVEIGQGIKTALAMIAAEELDVSVQRIVVQTADTELSPDEQVTSGSMSIEHSGSAVRTASATAASVLRALAAQALGVSEHTLQVEDGMLSSPDTNEQADYWSLQGGHPFGIRIVEAPACKDPHTYTVVGHKQPRLDLPAKVTGAPAFVHDLILPHLRHARIIKPPAPDARLELCPEQLHVAEVEIVRDGSFLGVIAPTEFLAVRAAEQLAARCRWSDAPITTLPAGIPDYLRHKVSQSLPVVQGTPEDRDPSAPDLPPEADTTHSASYFRPYQMHGAMGPSAAVAQFRNGLLTIHSHSQGIELLKLAVADVIGLPPDQIHVVHVEGAGCYGHNGADDVALDAALMALAAEPDPVSVKWTRADEHGCEPYGPAALQDLQASLDSNGRIVDWRHEAYSFSHIGRPRPTPGYSNLQSAWLREKAMAPPPRRALKFAEVGIHRNLTPIYDFAEPYLVKHLVADSPLRTSSLRSLGAFANVFAIESFMDELALAAEVDPFDLRLAHLSDPRALQVLQQLRQSLAAHEPIASGGRGIALARYKNQQTYCAIGVDVTVSDIGEVRLQRAVISADAGLVIDPDGLINQLEGGFIQAASWTLKEAVEWNADGITSRDWDSYPILRFSEIPEIETHILPSSGPAMGAGEASTGPTPAAIANAVCAATGLRVRSLPMTPERLRETAAL